MGGKREFFATFPAETHSPALAREFVLRRLQAAGYGDHDQLDRICLAISELVNNVVAHAKTDLEVRVVPESNSIYAEVLDRARDRPRPAGAEIDALHGRGLILIDALVDEWGVAAVTDGPGKRVWIRVAASGVAGR